jgi:hypothetical protein
MIAAGIGNHSAPPLTIRERRDLVISSAQFEGANRLKVFRLEEKLAVIPGQRKRNERRADGNAV